jgi:hypothetical protein
MCIFSQRIDHVGSTRIFAADLGNGVHATAYQMAFRAPEPVAMILPVPALKGTGDEALTFIDLAGYDAFFKDLDRCFPRPRGIRSGGGYGVAETPPAKRVRVHEVGDYEASYVPSLADFHRLDPRFRLPTSGWETLPDYHDFSFAVFQLRPGRGMRRVHPIADRYPAERPEELFFPTVHVHDGGHAERRAGFDHELYAQGTWPTPDRDSAWRIGSLLPGRVLDIGRSQGLVAPEVPIRREKLHGDYPNADVVALGGDRGMRAEARPVRVGSRLGRPMRWKEFERRGKVRYDGSY